MDSNNQKYYPVLCLETDTVNQITHRLLPFARVGNADAIYLSGMIAPHVQDDVRAGLALFERGIQDGDSPFGMFY